VAHLGCGPAPLVGGLRKLELALAQRVGRLAAHPLLT
jgi:hypothetical protein